LVPQQILGFGALSLSNVDGAALAKKLVLIRRQVHEVTVQVRSFSLDIHQEVLIIIANLVVHHILHHNVFVGDFPHIEHVGVFTARQVHIHEIDVDIDERGRRSRRLNVNRVYVHPAD
ncbi:hypothetical protein N657DRAFT_637948, partial [Parathielavia appendiculata]